MAKTDKNFVQNNIRNLIDESFVNAERHFEVAVILRSKQCFCSSMFHSISALEELAKWHFLNQDNIDFAKLEKITDHNFKIDEILKIFKKISDAPPTESGASDATTLISVAHDLLYLGIQHSARFPFHSAR